MDGQEDSVPQQNAKEMGSMSARKMHPKKIFFVGGRENETRPETPFVALTLASLIFGEKGKGGGLVIKGGSG